MSYLNDTYWADGKSDDGHDETLRLVALSKTHPVTYQDLILHARDLIEPGTENTNPEYERGIYELLARTFGVVDMPTDDRASWIESDVVGANSGWSS